VLEQVGGGGDSVSEQVGGGGDSVSEQVGGGGDSVSEQVGGGWQHGLLCVSTGEKDGNSNVAWGGCVVSTGGEWWEQK
jgi:hypothetical protein